MEANAQLRSLQIGARGSLDLGYGLDWKQELDLKEVFTANFASPKGNMGSPTLYMWLALLVSLKSLKTDVRLEWEKEILKPETLRDEIYTGSRFVTVKRRL